MGRVADLEAVREGTSSAESVPKRRSCEVHPGADPVKVDLKVAGYVLHTLHVL